MCMTDTERQPSDTGEQRRLGLLIRCILIFTGKAFVIQPDDSFDDYAHRHERTLSNSQALPREERRVAAHVDGRTRTGGKVFLTRVTQVRFLSGPPNISALRPHHRQHRRSTTPIGTPRRDGVSSVCLMPEKRCAKAYRRRSSGTPSWHWSGIRYLVTCCLPTCMPRGTRLLPIDQYTKQWSSVTTPLPCSIAL